MMLNASLLIEYFIYGFAIFFALIGLSMIVKGILRRDPASLYGVQRQQARQQAVGRIFRGIGLILFAVFLGFAGLRFQIQAQQPDSLEPTSVDAQDAPAADPTQPVVLEAVEPSPTPEPQPTEPPTLLPEPESVEEVVPAETLTEAEDVNSDEIEATPLPEPTEVETTEVSTPPTPTVSPWDAVVNIVGGLYLRDQPNGNVIVLLDDGSGLNLLDETQTSGAYVWQRVQTPDGTEGWVAEDFIIRQNQ